MAGNGQREQVGGRHGQAGRVHCDAQTKISEKVTENGSCQKELDYEIKNEYE
jgi:hypothetical protein